MGVVGSCASSWGWGWGMQTRPSLSPSTRSAGDPAAHHRKNYMPGHILLLLFWGGGGWFGQGALSILANGRCARLSVWYRRPPETWGRTKARVPPKAQARGRRRARRRPSPAPRSAEPPEPRLGAGWGGCSSARLPGPAPSQAPTRPGRLLARTRETPRRESAAAAWPAQPGSSGHQIDEVSRRPGREGGCPQDHGLAWSRGPGQTLLPHPPCPRRLEIKRVTRQLLSSQSARGFQVLPWAWARSSGVGGSFSAGGRNCQGWGWGAGTGEPEYLWRSGHTYFWFSTHKFLSHVAHPCPGTPTLPTDPGLRGRS